jgi:hypothetical protein
MRRTLSPLALALALCAAPFEWRAALADSGVPADDAGDEESDPPLTTLEARVGYGVAFGGGAGTSIERLSPLTFTALVDHAVVVDPWTSIFGGVVAEGYGRGAAGVLAGARVRPGRGRLRIAGGAEVILVPSTLAGPLASVGVCLPVAGVLSLCIDAEATLFVAGTDLPDERIAGQAQLVLGVAFDAL